MINTIPNYLVEDKTMVEFTLEELVEGKTVKHTVKLPDKCLKFKQLSAGLKFQLAAEEVLKRKGGIDEQLAVVFDLIKDLTGTDLGEVDLDLDNITVAMQMFQHMIEVVTRTYRNKNQLLQEMEKKDTPSKKRGRPKKAHSKNA